MGQRLHRLEPVLVELEGLIAALAAVTGRRARLALAPAARPDLVPVDRLLAGAAEVDITPPPGLPRAGYSRNARTGTGFRTRLRARVVHLRSGPGSVAIVATDLLGGSAVVQHLVARRIAAVTDVPLAGLFLGATHTHGAPGQFHGTDFYNQFSSNRPGFDPAWTAFLAERISAAVIEAVAGRRPARLAWGRAQVPGVTRNRALAAHRRNAGRAGEGATTAVNPWLDLLRVDAEATDGGTEPLAALAVYSIHGTAVPMTSSTYNADLWAYLCGSLADSVLASHGRRPVTGALQGTHGDLTPALLGPAGHPEAARIGRRLGAAAAALYESLDGRLAAPTPVPVVAGFREVSLAGRPAAGGVRLPHRPAVGAALLAGAKENETPGVSLLPPFRAGYGKRVGGRGPQGAKWVVGSRWLQPLVLPLAGFPRVLPVHLVRVGEVLLTGLPMEITLESGRRIGSAAAAGWTAGGGDPVRAVVSSVADEYAGYCTTSAEYTAQYYEGGHTLYGPATQRFAAGVVGELAADLARARGRAVQDELPARCFDLRVRRFLPTATGPAPAGPARPVGPPLSAPSFTGTGPQLSGFGSPIPGIGPGGEPYLEWRWLDPAPGHLTWHEPMVRISIDGPAGSTGWSVEDDDGDLEVVHLGPAEASADHLYAARWYTAPGHPAPGRPYRFTRL